MELVNRHPGSPPSFPPAQEVQGFNNKEGILWLNLFDFRTDRERKLCISLAIISLQWTTKRFFCHLIPQWKGPWRWETPTSCVLLPFWKKRERKTLLKAVFPTFTACQIFWFWALISKLTGSSFSLVVTPQIGHPARQHEQRTELHLQLGHHNRCCLCK